MTENLLEIAFILPALNEQQYISKTLCAITDQAARANLRPEVIVVDNGSTDHTVEIARQFGAVVHVVPDVSPGALRNVGVARSMAEIIVFIDADVELTDDWGAEIAQVIEQIKNDGRQIIGSWVVPPESENVFHKYWFRNLHARAESGDIKYIGTGHMIIHRRFFNEIGRFDPRLKSGEDYDLSQRALCAGGRLKINNRLVAIHHGFPSSCSAFIRRERWHGAGDFKSMRTVTNSVTALATIAFFSCHLLLGVSVLASYSLDAAFSLSMLGALLLGATYKKFGRLNGRSLMVCSAIMYAYFFGRMFSLIDAVELLVLGSNKRIGGRIRR